MQNLEAKIGQLATSINHIHNEGSNTLPAQLVTNPNVSAIILRIDKAIKSPKVPTFIASASTF